MTQRLAQCPSCGLAFVGPPPETCPSCKSYIASLTEGTASDTDSIVVSARVVQDETAPGTGPSRCRFCDLWVFGGQACPACGRPVGGQADPPPARTPSAPAAPPVAPVPKAWRQAREMPVFRGPAPAAKAVEQRKSRLRKFRLERGLVPHLVRSTHRAFFKSPFVVGSVLLHLLLVAFVAHLVFARVQERKQLPVFLSLRDRDEGPPGPGDGDDVEEEEPKPAEEVPPEKPEEVVAPPKRPEVAPPTAPVGPAATAPAPSPKRDGPDRAGAYGNRSGTGKGEALRRFGGSHRSEAAVRAGLDWLARHQEPSGKWSTMNFPARCEEGDLCKNTGIGNYDAGLTGLALLCFLGAGHTHCEKGPYRGTVKRALGYFMKVQYEDGCYCGKVGSYMYDHVIPALAMTEAYGLTRDPRLKLSVCRGLEFLCACQQKGGGWDYTDTRTNRNDTSISGWAVMALKSASAAKLPVPRVVWARARAYLRKAVTLDGRVRYADSGFMGFNNKVRYGVGMAAVGLLCCLYFGELPTSPKLEKLCDKILANPPDDWAHRHERLHTDYYWYYATLALFHVGGRRWQRWNGVMRDFLVERQRRSGCARGSWDPDDGWLGRYGGRLYSTTFSILNLEVYYRYLPIYTHKGEPGKGGPEDGDEDLEALEALALASSRKAKVGKRLKAIVAVGKLGTDEALGVLWELLEDPNEAIRWKTAEVLAKTEDPRSVPRLLAAAEKDGGNLVPTYIDALRSLGHASAVPGLIGFLTAEKKRVRTKALAALEGITGQDFGPNPSAWRNWLSSKK